jgi:hypothetical protein
MKTKTSRVRVLGGRFWRILIYGGKGKGSARVRVRI